jgi:hypothetical protein
MRPFGNRSAAERALDRTNDLRPHVDSNELMLDIDWSSERILVHSRIHQAVF